MLTVFVTYHYFLGLKNLDIITDALRFIKERTGEDIDIEKIPFEEKVFSKIYSAGLTNSVFQFESSGMKNMIKQFQPNSIDDIILLVAAYRPGPMQYLDKIIKVKHGKEKISYITPELEPILKPTYGAIIYQEQVQQVFRDLAGYSLGQADLVRRAMSKKKEAIIQAERTAFVYGDSKRGIVGCQKNGIDPDKANKLFDEILDFAQYAFNKSHAAAYAIVSYMTAWLKCNYTIEYMCAVMSRTELTKMAGLISDCKIMGIDVLQPDINESEIGFSIKNSAIVFGLSCIKNVGNSAEPIIAERMKNGRFVSLKDFVKRYNVKKDVLESLIYSGALDSFGKNRYAMAYIIEDIKKLTKIISDKENVLETAKVELDGIFNEIKDQGLIDSTFLDERCSLAEQYIIDIVEKTKETKKRECKAKGTALKSKATQIRKAKEAINDAKFEFSRIVVPNLSENKKERLAKEKEMLGIYVSEHPLDSYPSAASLETTEIIDLEANKFSSVIGIISNLRKTVTKKGNKPLAFFTLEDKTGTIDVNCFTAAYDEFGEFIDEDAVVIIEGKCTEEEAFNSKSEDSDDDDEIETVKKLTVKNIKPVKAKERTLSLHVPSIEFWNDNLVENIKRYLADDGYRLIIYDELFNEYRYTDLFVSGDILNNNLSLKAIILE